MENGEWRMDNSRDEIYRVPRDLSRPVPSAKKDPLQGVNKKQVPTSDEQRGHGWKKMICLFFRSAPNLPKYALRY